MHTFRYLAAFQDTPVTAKEVEAATNILEEFLQHASQAYEGVPHVIAHTSMSTGCRNVETESLDLMYLSDLDDYTLVCLKVHHSGRIGYAVRSPRREREEVKAREETKEVVVEYSITELLANYRARLIVDAAKVIEKFHLRPLRATASTLS